MLIPSETQHGLDLNPPLPDDDKPQLMEVEVELPTAHSVNLSSSPSSRTITSCGNLDEGFHGHVNFIAKGDCKNSEELFFAEVVTMAPEFIIQEVFQVFPLTNNTAISVEMSLSIQKMEHCMRVAMLLREEDRKASSITLLNWILLVSRVVWDKPGNLCLRQRRRLSARPASITFLSCSSSSATSSLTAPHRDLPWLAPALRRHTYIAASTLSAIASASCSDDMSRQSSRYSGENFSAPSIALYTPSPTLAFPLCQEHDDEQDEEEDDDDKYYCWWYRVVWIRWHMSFFTLKYGWRSSLRLDSH
uniref:DUF3615 domain-containing protein n=1 Tax=Oryza glumipatula TaxID=40148 RepID=A0A0E0BDH0_9ORYZ